MDTTIDHEILNHLPRLSQPQKQQVLSLVRSLAGQQGGVPGHSLIRFAGAIPAEELSRMAEAINEKS
jgi:hypothetical protein